MHCFATSLQTVALRKEYPGTVALKDVSVNFDGGRIHALLGKNGAGKSTLVRLFAGAIQPTAGSILVDGTAVHLRSPREALRQGIAAVHQELSLVPELSIAENIFLGRLPKHRGTRETLIDWKSANDRAARLLSDFGLTMNVRTRAGSLGVAHQQMVEIVKAMSYEPSVLMLDEPTSALAHHETDRLFELLRTLASRGVVLLYITHRLEEIHRISDTVTVLRNGELVGTIPISQAGPAVIVQMMFGETVQRSRPEDVRPLSKPVMEVRHLSRTSVFEDISFTLHEGEILGIAGLLGSGRSELLRSLFGADPPDRGDIVIEGTPVRPRSPNQMKRFGVALAPEKRKEEGLVQILSTRANICLASLSSVATAGFITRARERAVTERYIRDINIAVANPEAAISSLSGGNQQKVVIAKWLRTHPRVILLDEPTRGIDIQAKQQIFQIIWDLSRKGIGTVVVSSELEELLDVCHRILILKKGRIAGEMLPHQSTLEQLLSVCMQ
jgi:ribose transport system ATP-binding protein